jgi:CheY-like chemotaxis protein
VATRVLIFEDADATRREYAQLFSQAGILTRFHTKQDLTQQDIERFVAFAPNLIVMDLLLGSSKLDGYTLIRRLQQNRSLKLVPIVVVSKFVNLSDIGQREAEDVKSLPGVVASYSKLSNLPSLEVLLSHAKSA